MTMYVFFVPALLPGIYLARYCSCELHVAEVEKSKIFASYSSVLLSARSRAI